MQNEWDSLMIETFQIRNHLDTIRQQLSHSLYQHDAACRVIARLVKERDGLRLQLSQLQDQLSHSVAAQDVPLGVSTGGGRDGIIVDGDIGLSSDIIEEWKSLAKSLLNRRKKRNLEGLTPIEDIRKWKEKGSYSIHSSTTPGIFCCASDPKPSGSSSCTVWTGGVDGLVALFDIDQERVRENSVIEADE